MVGGWRLVPCAGLIGRGSRDAAFRSQQPRSAVDEKVVVVTFVVVSVVSPTLRQMSRVSGLRSEKGGEGRKGRESKRKRKGR